MVSEVYKSEQALFLLDYMYVLDECISFSAYIKSFRYSGEHIFKVKYARITEIIFTLELMNRKSLGEVVLCDMESDSFILLKFENEVLYLSGKIGGSTADHNMNFKFEADKSIIGRLIENLNNSLERSIY